MGARSASKGCAFSGNRGAQQWEPAAQARDALSPGIGEPMQTVGARGAAVKGCDFIYVSGTAKRIAKKAGRRHLFAKGNDAEASVDEE